MLAQFRGPAQLDKTSTATLHVFAAAGTDRLFCIKINFIVVCFWSVTFENSNWMSTCLTVVKNLYAN